MDCMVRPWRKAQAPHAIEHSSLSGCASMPVTWQHTCSVIGGVVHKDEVHAIAVLVEVGHLLQAAGAHVERYPDPQVLGLTVQLICGCPILIPATSGQYHEQCLQESSSHEQRTARSQVQAARYLRHHICLISISENAVIELDRMPFITCDRERIRMALEVSTQAVPFRLKAFSFTQDC